MAFLLRTTPVFFASLGTLLHLHRVGTRRHGGMSIGIGPEELGPAPGAEAGLRRTTACAARYGVLVRYQAKIQERISVGDHQDRHGAWCGVGLVRCNSRTSEPRTH